MNILELLKLGIDVSFENRKHKIYHENANPPLPTIIITMKAGDDTFVQEVTHREIEHLKNDTLLSMYRRLRTNNPLLEGPQL